MAKILIVDDEEVIRETLKDILKNENYDLEEAKEGQEALNLIKNNKFDCVLLDIKMPKMDGIEVLEKALEINPDVPIIMITGHGNEETAFEAAKKGAYDFINKPPDLNRLLLTIRNALDKSDLISETKVLKKQVSKTRDIIGNSPAIDSINKTIEKVAPTDARVLIMGANGTGKELVARWIHEKSTRADAKMVEVNCAAIPSELIESELFGHEKGSFTSAVKQHIGKFEQAHQGTLFLDEIGDMGHSAQAKVLRALEEGKIYRVGGDKPIEVNVRVIAATNKDIREEIDKGNFREDLYHRLSVILIRVPSLNERKDDIPMLAEHFIDEICREYALPRREMTQDAYEALKQINWTGNVRELHNVIERLIILTNDKISKEDVDLYAQPISTRKSVNQLPVDQYNQLQDFRDYAERIFIESKLKHNNWNISKTAEEIGIQRSHLYNKIDKYDLKKEQIEEG